MNARTPPAFIPTLTRELQEGEASALQTAPLLIDLPLLEEEVLPPEAQYSRVTVPLGDMPATSSSSSPSPATVQVMPIVAPVAAPVRYGIDDSAKQAEQMRARLLQRVDVIVQRRVREATAAIALEHAQNLLHELRPALEKAIKDAVDEALALEVSSRAKH